MIPVLVKRVFMLAFQIDRSTTAVLIWIVSALQRGAACWHFVPGLGVGCCARPAGWGGWALAGSVATLTVRCDWV